MIRTYDALGLVFEVSVTSGTARPAARPVFPPGAPSGLLDCWPDWYRLSPGSLAAADPPPAAADQATKSDKAPKEWVPRKARADGCISEGDKLGKADYRDVLRRQQPGDKAAGEAVDTVLDGWAMTEKAPGKWGCDES